MALELQRCATPGEQNILVSLEDTKESACAAWPRLNAVADNLIFLNKKPGLRPGVIQQLVEVINELKPAAVHSHHIGPLIYGGLATRIASKNIQFVHTEHDAWHLNNLHRRLLVCLIVNAVCPQVIQFR